MADQFYPAPEIFNIAGDIECEAQTLLVGLDLVNDALQFSYGNADEAKAAQNKLFYLAASLKTVQERLEALAASAYAMSEAQKTAA